MRTRPLQPEESRLSAALLNPHGSTLPRGRRDRGPPPVKARTAKRSLKAAPLFLNSSNLTLDLTHGVDENWMQAVLSVKAA